MEFLDSVKNVLIIYEDENNLNEFIEKCKEKNASAQYTGKTPEQLINETIPLSTYDLVFSGYTSSHGMLHEDRLLAKILKVLKMKCTFALRALVDAQDNFSKKLVSQLKISGFLNISEPAEVALKNNEIDELKKKFDVKTDLKLFEVKCNKADHEVGSFVVLKFGKKKEAKSSVWKIDASDDNDESIDPDTLLDEDDLKKPDPSSLRVCGTTGKRKACKDCSCGLAEELETETATKNPNPLPKSSCGSCYLGDAFRCATCPYLGMPAFKPGEKIQLAENQLKPDI